jgi:hypothetical protein
MNFRKQAFLIATSYLLCLCVNTAAFGSSSLPTKAAKYSATAIHAEAPGSRRKVLGNFRRSVVGAATLSVFRQGPKVAVADDVIPTTGRIVEMTIANLDGIEGNTGTVKIQLRPEWAPRGVKRFEVCFRPAVILSEILFLSSADLTPFLSCSIFRN